MNGGPLGWVRVLPPPPPKSPSDQQNIPKSQSTENYQDTKKAPKSEGPEEAYCKPTPNIQHSSQTRSLDTTTHSTTSADTGQEHEETTTSTHNEKIIQYNNSEATKTADKVKIRNNIKQQNKEMVK